MRKREVKDSSRPTTADGSTECVSQEELAAVKAEMERRVDQLDSQLHYWQNVTVNILKDHCSAINTGIYRAICTNHNKPA